ncbi:hypothetical protein QBC45DRAFT_412421 [Copromyces sp. CBS 386.78]|nr:hypothetical protein QBC45DRAFT_412421 [Copromyces sp. CBS 386.78]
MECLTHDIRREARGKHRETSHRVRFQGKVNLVRGGMTFHMHHHHFTNDVMSWYGYARQIAENCNAIFNNTTFPSWDPAALDLSRLCKPQPSPEAMITVPPALKRHPGHSKGVSLLFHLPEEQGNQVKKPLLARRRLSPLHLHLRLLQRLHLPHPNPSPRPRLQLPLRHQALLGRSYRHASPSSEPQTRAPPSRQRHVLRPLDKLRRRQPTLAQVASEWSLSRLATYIRQMTDSVTPEALDAALDMVSIVRNKSELCLSVDGTPPMSVLLTDHRDAYFWDVSFGFGTPLAYRHSADRITNGLILFYPLRDLSPESDEGVEFFVYYEKRLAQALIGDPEWCEFMEYRGVEAEDSVVREGDEEDETVKIVEKVRVKEDKKGWIESVTVGEVLPAPLA